MEKKIFYSVALSVLLLPVLAFAQGDSGLEPYAPGAPQVGSLQDLIHSIENLVGLVFGAIAVVMFVAAGVLFLTAQGEPEKIKTARYAFMWGVVGVIVGIVAFSIIAIVSVALT